MIEGGWDYVVPAYAVTLGAILVLTLAVIARLRLWARRAREVEKHK